MNIEQRPPSKPTANGPNRGLRDERPLDVDEKWVEPTLASVNQELARINALAEKSAATAKDAIEGLQILGLQLAQAEHERDETKALLEQARETIADQTRELYEAAEALADLRRERAVTLEQGVQAELSRWAKSVYGATAVVVPMVLADGRYCMAIQTLPAESGARLATMLTAYGETPHLAATRLGHALGFKEEGHLADLGD